MIERWFLAHPRSVGESYFEHMGAALGFSLALFRAAAACLLHALLPGTFQTTASRTVQRLHEEMVVNRAARRAARVHAARAGMMARE